MNPMVVRTKGQAALRRAIEQETITQAEVVEAVGVVQASVSTWSTGASRPDAVQREALRRCYAIPVSWWLTTEERARLGRMRLRKVLVRGHGAIVRAGGGSRKVNGSTGDSMDRSNRAGEAS